MNESDLDKIMRWPVGDYGGLFSFVQSELSNYGRFWYEGVDIKIATGGWSGNEEIISAMQANHIFWATCWQSSHRGGLFIFRLPT